MGKRPPENNDVEAGAKTNHAPYPHTHWTGPPAPMPWFPWLVPSICLANVAMFVYTMYVNNCPETTGAQSCILYHPLKRFSFQPWKENYVLGPSVDTLEGLGALERTPIVEDGEWWRLFSNIWLHGGVIHLGANMMSLLMVGVRLEEEFGFWKIGLLYLLSGFGGSLMSVNYTKSSMSVGASGAILGLLGAMLSELIENWTIYANKCATISSLTIIIVLNLAVGFIPRVDSYAHTGGMISGFLLGFILLVRPQHGYVSRRYIPAGYEVKNKKSKYKCYQHILWVIALVGLILGFALGLVVLYHG